MNNGTVISSELSTRFAALLDDALPPARSDFSEFINNGLRTAKSCRTRTRSAILADVAAVLSCSAEELGFMFDDTQRAANDVGQAGHDAIAVPDFREMLQGLAAE